MEVWVIWLIIAGALLVIEMLTLTLYLLWLGVGAIVAAIIAWVAPEAYFLQVIAGAVIALGLTASTKPLTSRIRVGRGYRDTIDDLIGKEGIVVEPIPEGRPGIVKVGNERWSATADRRLDVGDRVIVIHRGTTTLKVRYEGGEA